MQANVLRNIAGMTKRSDDIPTHQIGKQCPDALGMSCGCSGGTRM